MVVVPRDLPRGGDDRRAEGELLGDPAVLGVPPAGVLRLPVAGAALEPLEPVDRPVVLVLRRPGLRLHPDEVARVDPHQRRERVAGQVRPRRVEVLRVKSGLGVERSDRPVRPCLEREREVAPFGIGVKNAVLVRIRNLRNRLAASLIDSPIIGGGIVGTILTVRVKNPQAHRLVPVVDYEHPDVVRRDRLGAGPGNSAGAGRGELHDVRESGELPERWVDRVHKRGRGGHHAGRAAEIVGSHVDPRLVGVLEIPVLEPELPERLERRHGGAVLCLDPGPDDRLPTHGAAVVPGVH